MYLFCRLRSSLWLQFKPHHIAAGAAFLAAKLLNLDHTSIQSMWQEFKTTPAIVQGIMCCVFEHTFLCSILHFCALKFLSNKHVD